MSAAIRPAIRLVIGVVIFIGLPLLGWGVGDIAGFLAHPARAGYVVMVVLLQLIIVTKIPDAGSGRSGEDQTSTGRRFVLLLLQLIPLLLMVAAPYSDGRGWAVLPDQVILRFVGLFLFVFGMAGMHWAEAVLGKQFSVQVTIQEGHQLVTEGPYGYLRHPRYLCILLFTAGLALLFRSWLGLILVAALTLVLVVRVQDEEGLMRQEFGSEWQKYAQRTWRFIPFVY